jgi:pSer/pThr/pTyr-binding forkhead associated (FHA) protein
MAKLVVLSEGMTGRTHELKVEKTTIGRVDDNTFQIAEPSVSSHHCEIVLRGNEVLVKDLNSTNGSFINGERINEAVLKPGQTLRLGQIEMRLETDAPQAAAKKTTGPTIAMQRGVSLTELETGSKGGRFETASKGFSKKEDKAGKIFWIAAVAVGVVIVCLLIYVFLNIKGSGNP